jgi:hypothetical protein
MTQLLRYFKFNVQEDEKLLQDELNFNTSNCIKMRLGEKKILQFYIKFVDYCLPLFDLTEKVNTNLTKGNKR